MTVVHAAGARLQKRVRTGGVLHWGTMAARLSDNQRELIRQAWLAGADSIAAVQALTGCSEGSVRRYKPDPAELATVGVQKKADLEAAATAEIRGLVIAARRALVTEMIKPEKLRTANVQQLATSFGILTDKQLLEDGKATARHEHLHDWRADVAAVAMERGLDPDEVIAATEALIAERYGVSD